jgi:protein-tyrosine phosphatase
VGKLLESFEELKGLTMQSKSTGVHFSKCRHKPSLIFKTPEGIEIYGASECYIDAHSVREMDLVVRLLGRRRGAEIVSGSDRWAKLNETVEDFMPEEPEEICIDWPDYGVIKAGREFWEKFLENLKEGKYKKVLFYCFGGHGRTGTAVASLMTVACDIHGGQAIREIRKYCQHAIETKGQEDYVRRMTRRRDRDRDASGRFV